MVSTFQEASMKSVKNESPARMAQVVFFFAALTAIVSCKNEKPLGAVKGVENTGVDPTFILACSTEYLRQGPVRADFGIDNDGRGGLVGFGSIGRNTADRGKIDETALIFNQLKVDVPANVRGVGGILPILETYVAVGFGLRETDVRGATQQREEAKIQVSGLQWQRGAGEAAGMLVAQGLLRVSLSSTGMVAGEAQVQCTRVVNAEAGARTAPITAEQQREQELQRSQPLAPGESEG
jgi:hypothetical protein